MAARYGRSPCLLAIFAAACVPDAEAPEMGTFIPGPDNGCKYDEQVPVGVEEVSAFGFAAADARAVIGDSTRWSVDWGGDDEVIVTWGEPTAAYELYPNQYNDPMCSEDALSISLPYTFATADGGILAAGTAEVKAASPTEDAIRFTLSSDATLSAERATYAEDAVRAHEAPDGCTDFVVDRYTMSWWGMLDEGIHPLLGQGGGGISMHLDWVGCQGGAVASIWVVRDADQVIAP